MEEDEKVVAINGQEMDTKAEEWTKEQGKESSLELDFEGIDHTQKS